MSDTQTILDAVGEVKVGMARLEEQGKAIIERLDKGDEKFKDHEDRIRVVEKEPPKPEGKGLSFKQIVYLIIIVGGIISGIVATIYGTTPATPTVPLPTAPGIESPVTSEAPSVTP